MIGGVNWAGSSILSGFFFIQFGTQNVVFIDKSFFCCPCTVLPGAAEGSSFVPKQQPFTFKAAKEQQTSPSTKCDNFILAASESVTARANCVVVSTEGEERP